MKTTFKQTCIILLVLSMFTGCTKDEISQPETPTTTDLLLVSEKVNGQTTVEYSYDNRNRMTQMKEIFAQGASAITSIKYDGSDRMILTEKKENGRISFIEEYLYNEDSRPASGTWTILDQSSVSEKVKVVYTYDGNSVSEKVTTPQGTSVVNRYVINKNGNLTSFERNGAATYLSDYDDKTNANKYFPWSFKLKYTNNFGSLKVETTGIVLEEIWKYTYNEAGYPEKALVFDGTTKKLVKTIESTYIKAK